MRLVKLKQSGEWNGRIGEVLSFDEHALRYDVRVSESKVLRVKLENALL